MSTVAIPPGPSTSVVAPLPGNLDVRPDVLGMQLSPDAVTRTLTKAVLTHQDHIDSVVACVVSIANYINDQAAQTGGSGGSGTGSYAAISGSSFAPDLSMAQTWACTMTGNATINATTNVSAGQILILILIQDAIGGRQVTTWDASYKKPTFGLDPTANTATVFLFVANAAADMILVAAPVTGITWP